MIKHAIGNQPVLTLTSFSWGRGGSFDENGAIRMHPRDEAEGVHNSAVWEVNNGGGS